MLRIPADGLARQLLRRVVAAGAAERFTFAEVIPLRERMRFIVSLESLVEAGWAERVPVGCGKWWYRLTPAGIEQAKAPPYGCGRRPWASGAKDQKPMV
jgi:hypothetical protein